MSQQLLSSQLAEPEYMEDRGPDVVAVLRDQLSRLERRVADLESSRDLIKRDAVVLVLGLLAKSMKLVASGEIDIDSADTGAASSATSSRWEAIKRSLPPRLAQAVDIVLLRGAMNNSQLAAAMKMDRTNCSNNVTSKLKSMGLFIKNGNVYSLKDMP